MHYGFSKYIKLIMRHQLSWWRVISVSYQFSSLVLQRVALERSYKFVTQRSALYQRIVEKNVMKACIKALMTNGYYIHDFSPVRLRTLHEDNPNVIPISERIAEDNQNDMCMYVYSFHSWLSYSVWRHNF